MAGVNAKLFSWVLREAVTNMVRHSGANAARVRLSATGLDILDNGVGVGDARGNGLTGMAQRVAASGGSVVIEAAPEQWLAENPGGGGGYPHPCEHGRRHLTAVDRCCRLWNLAPRPGRGATHPCMVVVNNLTGCSARRYHPVFALGRFP